MASADENITDSIATVTAKIMRRLGRLICGVDVAVRGNPGNPGSGGASPYLSLRLPEFAPSILVVLVLVVGCPVQSALR